MALAHSPRIVTDNLVFAYDMDNRKSFKGAPTTNILTSPLDPTSWGMYTDPVYGFVSDEYFTYNGELGNNIPAYRRTVSGADYRGTRIDVPWTTPTDMTTPITGSIFVRCLNPDPGGATTVNINFQGLDSLAARVDTNTSISITDSNWVRLSDTQTLSSSGFVSQVNYMKYYVNGDATTRTWEVMMPQVEKQTFATPFVNGTRSNTEAVLDQSRNEDTIATSLTYESDNTFTFNGSSDYIQIPNFAPTVGNKYTIEGWIYKTQSVINNAGFVLSGGYGGDKDGLTLQTEDYATTNNIYIDCDDDGISTDFVALYYNGESVPRLSSFNLNEWLHFSIVVTLLSVDGEPHFIGANNNFTNFFGGKISNLKIYEGELTASEVKQNFNALRGRFGL